MEAHLNTLTGATTPSSSELKKLIKNNIIRWTSPPKEAMYNTTQKSTPQAPMNRYFAYGSNLDAAQMLTRCPSAQLLGVGQLTDHRLAFAGHSATWRGGVATVILQQGSHVDGLVWSINDTDLAILDRYEGHPHSYQRKRLLVWLDGQRRQAQVYIKPRPKLAYPSPAYFEVIYDAYIDHGFDLEPFFQAAGAL